MPFFQTFLGKIATQKLNEALGTQISVEKVHISVFGDVDLKGLYIQDQKLDTLLYVKNLKTSLQNINEVKESRIFLGDAQLHSFVFKVTKYKNDNLTSLDYFVSKVDDGKPGTGKFRLFSKNIKAFNSKVKIINHDKENPLILNFKDINGDISNFSIKGPEVTTTIKKLAFLDHRGINVKNLSGDFLYNKTNLYLRNFSLKTPETTLEGTVDLKYKPKDFQDFTNKVVVDAEIIRSKISTNDLNLLYNEFAPNHKFYISTHAKGILNDFTLNNLSLFHTSNSEIIGKTRFRNLFDKNKMFQMNGNFAGIKTSYQKTKSILPRVLGNTLPEILNKLGDVIIEGDVDVTTKDLYTDINLLSNIGSANAVLTLEGFNDKDNVLYNGDIALDKFNIGYLLDQKSLNIATFNVTVDGKGFTAKGLDTSVLGVVDRFDFGGYSYSNIEIDGNFKLPYFKGYLNSNDPNLKMDFNGLVNLQDAQKEFDFTAHVDYANLHLFNIRKKDETAVFRGNIVVQAKGNTIDDIVGVANISDVSILTTSKDYFFDDFEVTSSFDDQKVRTLTINSPDIISGKVSGIFKINQVSKLVQNALGSLYANYKPYSLHKGQFIDFDFSIYNKIVEVFDSSINISEQTYLKGKIVGDENDFKMNFTSPEVIVYNNGFENINLQVNNQNPLFNTFIEMDSVKTANYKISDFSLINLTMNDTMFVRSEFKGGVKAQDFYNLNIYHTIDKDNKSVVGFKKSEVSFRDFLWYINEDEDIQDNKIIFNKSLTDFDINDITLSHEGQEMNLRAKLVGNNYKDINLDFKDVDLSKIAPSTQNLTFAGKIDGDIKIKQENIDQYKPSANIFIDDFVFNDQKLGDFTFKVTGDEKFRRFKVDANVLDSGAEKFNLAGTIDFQEHKKGKLDLEVTLDKFHMAPLEKVLGNIFKNIRGYASGKTLVEGNLSDPEINGRMYLTDAGMKIPFLGVDFDMEQNASIDVTENQFLLRHIKLTDTKHHTTAYIDGSVRHKRMQDWFLDVDVNSNNMLILDTKDNLESVFYGTAFIDGKANISGPVSSLVIDIHAKSNPGTKIKLPIGDNGNGLGDNSYIHFLSIKEKDALAKGLEINEKVISGIEMNFDLDITPDAEIEIILDRNSGHGMRGRGVGSINMEINTLGKFKMVGDYQVWDGEYNFKFGGVIDKKFEVKKYSTIRWADGNPMNAILNLQAVYKTESNPAVLLENPSFNRKIPTEVVIDLSGSLQNPQPDFVINFPNVSSIFKSEIDYKLQDKDTRQMQAMALLTGGGFLTQENAANAVTGSFIERAGSLFSDIFSGDEEIVKVGFNYTQADRNPYLQTEGRVGVTLSTNINERITVNGKVRVPVGGTEESTIIGDVEIALRLNEDGTLNARVFNRENDIYYFGEGIRYTQGVGISYQVDFDTFRELLSKIIKKASKEEKESKATDKLPDSDLSPEFIKFIESRRNKSEQKEPPKNEEPLRVPELD